MFERFFGSRESKREVPSSDALQLRNEEFERRLRDLTVKRADLRRKMRLLEREQREFKQSKQTSGSGRTLGDIVGEKGTVWREIDAVRLAINEVLDQVQTDDEALKKITNGEIPP